MKAVECKNVSIRYLKGDFKSIGLKDYVIRKLTGRYHVVEFWADKDITFSLEQGDMLGIIGTNGAGKSTLLKAIAGVLMPKEGKIKTNGKVAALLELSSGFDNEMTVKENVYLRGAIMGYTKKFLDDRYDEIISFAELEDFQDLNFKQLSSGMKSRLAFSIACLVEPDILILDEVLSVGDGAFKKKSGDRMISILQNNVTGILVSHSLQQVRNLCNKILWIDHGKQITFTEDVQTACDAYEEFMRTKQLPQNEEEIRQLADQFKAQTLEEKEAERQQEEARLQSIIERGESDAVIDAAIHILEKNRPEFLNEVEIRDYKKNRA